MIILHDTHHRDRWYDKINPEQTESLYSSKAYRDMEKEAKAGALDHRSVNETTKHIVTRYGNINDSDTSACSNKNK